MMIPPLTWLSAVNLLTKRPPSCTQVIFFTFVNPVSVSTSTSANWTPAAPPEESPSCHSPETVSGFTPNFLHALAQFSPFASATPDCFCNSSSALVHTSYIAGAMEGVVLLPPLPPEGGYRVSPTRTVICSGFKPSKSAAMHAITVLEPVPRSCVPQRISTLPSGLICASAFVPRPRPPHAADAQPTPVLIGPGELPAF